MVSRVLLISLLITGNTLLMQGTAQILQFTTENSQYQDSPFGFHPALPYVEAKNIGIQWTRGGNSPYLFWSLVDTNKTGDSAQFQWKGTTLGPTGQPTPFDYDALFLVRDAGLNMLQNIDVQPPQSQGGYRQSGSWLPVNEAAYRTFVKEAVKRYSFIRYWQVGNEPNLWPVRNLAGFADLQRITYEAIKEANPQAQVLMGGVAGNMGVIDMNDTYFESILPALSGKYMDVFDIHFYGDAKGGTLISDPQRRMLGYRDFKTVYTYFRNLLDQNGFSHVPIWVTEMGTFSGTVKMGPQTLTQTETEQARDLLKRWIYPLSLGVKKVFWAFGLVEGFGQWDDDFFDHTGLIYGGQDGVHRSGEKKLSYYTHKLMTEKLEGSDWAAVETVREDTLNNVYIYKFTKNGKPIYVAWWDYFNDGTYIQGKTKQISMTGLQSNTVLVTEAVPKFSSRAEVTDYAAAFRKDTLAVADGTITPTLGETPVFIEPLTQISAREEGQNIQRESLQSLPDRTIPIHSLATGSGQPNIVKMGSIVVDESRRRAYFTASLSQYIGVIDTDSLQMIGTIDSHVDGFVSRFLSLNPSTGVLYMFVIETSRLYRIDPVTGTVSSPISVERTPAFDASTNRLYISAPPSTIRVYTDMLQPVDSLTGVSAPGDLFIDSAQRKLYVVNSAPLPQGGVSVYHIDTKQLIRKYNMPAGFDGLPKGIDVDSGKIYVNGNTIKHSLSLIDEATGSGTYIILPEDGLRMETYGGRLYQMTGYPYYAGYLPTADGSYGVLEVRDALTGVKQTDLQTDLESLYFDIDQTTGRLFYTATGRGIIGVVSLPQHTTLKKIDVATTVEDILIHPADGNLYLRNRLGGSTIYRIDPNAGSLVRTLIPGNWPAKILLDAQRNRLYALSHYEAKVSLFDLVTDAKVMDIQLGTQRARTDALSTMVMNHTLGRLYVLTPELGSMTMVNADGSGSPITVAIEGFTPDPAGGGPGKLQIAVNELLQRVYVFIKDAKRLNIYDGTSLSLLTYSTILDFNQPVSPLDLLFNDEAGGRLFVGPHIVNPQTGAVIGRIPSGLNVIGLSPSRDRFYVMDFITAGFHERVLEYDASLQTVLRQWDLSPIMGVSSAFGFDFARGKMYVGYFDRGVVEAFNLA